MQRTCKLIGRDTCPYLIFIFTIIEDFISSITVWEIQKALGTCWHFLLTYILQWDTWHGTWWKTWRLSVAHMVPPKSAVVLYSLTHQLRIAENLSKSSDDRWVEKQIWQFLYFYFTSGPKPFFNFDSVLWWYASSRYEALQINYSNVRYHKIEINLQ